MVKELALGIIPAVLIFLGTIGVNVVPLLLLAVILGAAVFFLHARGELNFGIKDRARHVIRDTSIDFDDIGGHERVKRELKEALDFLKHKEKTSRYGIRPIKGILLSGPPGTGKTLLAKAAANYTDSVFLAASGSEFVEVYVGVGAQRVRDLFKEARNQATKRNKGSAIIFIDEIDVLAGKRDGSQAREYDQTLNQLLTEMDGISTAETPRILLIAATNRKDMLDEALLRPGRFDRHIEVDLPDKKARLQILQLHSRNKPLSTTVDLEKIAEETFGFSGAQLESLINEAAIYAMREKAEFIEPRHMAQAIDKVMLGEQTDKESTQEERRRVAVHELGHAIVSEILRPGSVSQVALSPRGGALGYVRQSPGEDRYLYTREYLEQKIMICLAGAAAEQLVYGQRSTGAKNDYEQAIRIAKTLIDAGLSSLGIVDVNLLNKETLHEEINRILNDLFQKTELLLKQHHPLFERALDILLQEEQLSGSDFRRLFQSDLEDQAG